MDTFAALAQERRRLADFLEGLEPDQWATPSCCEAWTVQDVAAHLLVGPKLGMRGVLPFMLKAGFRPNRTNVLTARHLAELGPDRIVAELRAVAESRFTPPGFPPEAPLIDVTIHGQDITRLLGATLDVPNEYWQHALEAATAARYAVVNARRKLKGLSFASTDTDFTWGEGPLVSGPARDLAHAMMGRAQALDALDGEGVAELRARLT